MSYFQKISKISVVLIPLAFFLYLIFLPWYAPIIVKSARPVNLVLDLERPDGKVFRETFQVSPERPLELRSMAIKNWSSEDAEALVFGSQGSLLTKSKEIQSKSLRTSFNVLISILFCTGCLAVLNFFFWRYFSSIGFFFKNFAAALAAHLLILGGVLYSNLPGLFSQDIFYNYWDAAGFNFSYFVGYIFSAVMIVGYQLFPSELFITFANIACISGILAALFVYCRKNHLTKWYVAICLLFYLYPVNLPLSLLANRDLLAHWFTLALSLVLYYFFHRRNHSWHAKALIFFLVLICCFIRQENLYIFLPGIMILSWFHFRELFRFSVATAITVFIIGFGLNVNNAFDKSNYESTLIVNPLSSILFNLYGKNLPPEINERLGKYYKNNYLVEFHNEDDIDSFHRGGVNYPVEIEDYKQFRKEALKIIISNPILFLKNRFHILKKSLGFSTNSQIIFSHHYQEDSTDFTKETKKRLNFRDHLQHGQIAKRLLQITAEKPAILVASYIIPIIIILAMCVISGLRSLYFGFALVILARMALVFLTAPASYFKYHYILWLFALFSLPFAIYEKRASLTKSPHELKTQ